IRTFPAQHEQPLRSIGPHHLGMRQTPPQFRPDSVRGRSTVAILQRGHDLKAAVAIVIDLLVEDIANAAGNVLHRDGVFDLISGPGQQFLLDFAEHRVLEEICVEPGITFFLLPVEERKAKRGFRYAGNSQWRGYNHGGTRMSDRYVGEIIVGKRRKIYIAAETQPRKQRAAKTERLRIIGKVSSQVEGSDDRVVRLSRRKPERRAAVGKKEAPLEVGDISLAGPGRHAGIHELIDRAVDQFGIRELLDQALEILEIIRR